MQNLEVKITEIRLGEGLVVQKGALVFIQYIGTLENGVQFDSSIEKGRPFEFVVGSSKVIKGMSQAVMGMKCGGKREVFIPAELAYGDRKIGKYIEANSNLIFNIELLEVRPREA